MKKGISSLLCLLMLIPSLLACLPGSGSDNGKIATQDTLSAERGKYVQTAAAKRVGKLTIAGNDISEYVIIRSEEADVCVKHAADELKAYIEKTVGAQLEITGEKGSHTRVIELVVDESGGHGVEGFTIAVENGNLFITGGTKRGCLYGVYEFLESYVGWRFMPEYVEYLYEAESVDVPEGTKDTQQAIFEERLTSYTKGFPGSTGENSSDLNCVVRRKMNGGTAGGYHYSAEQGGGHGRTFINAHSFMYQMPDVCDARTQPCLSDEKNFQNCMAFLFNLADERMGWGAEVTQLAVGPNDNNNFCTCAECTKAAAEEGGQSGPLIRFVNRCQLELQKYEKYKHIQVFTLAYGYTSTMDPPKVTRPADGVVVCCCASQACNNHAMNDPDCPWNVTFSEQLDGWLKICDNVYAWHYTTNFPFAMSILGNFNVLREDARYLAEKGVKSIYFEGTGFRYYEATMGDLRCYLLSKLLWDPYMSEEEYNALIDEFFMIMYGGGYKELHEYMDIMTEAANRAKPSHFLGNRESPVQTVLYAYIAQNFEHMLDLFERAEALTETQEQKDRLYIMKTGFWMQGLTAVHDTRYEWGNEQIREEYTAWCKELWTFLKESHVDLSCGDNIYVPEIFVPSEYPMEWYKPCPFVTF